MLLINRIHLFLKFVLLVSCFAHIELSKGINNTNLKVNDIWLITKIILLNQFYKNVTLETNFSTGHSKEYFMVILFR